MASSAGAAFGRFETVFITAAALVAWAQHMIAAKRSVIKVGTSPN